MKPKNTRSLTTLKTSRSKFNFLASASLLLCCTCQAATVTWFAPKDAATSNATFNGTATTYTTNYGVAFTTGSTGTYSMDWATIGLNTSTAGVNSASFKIAIRNTNNNTAYSARADTTEYAVDTVTFTLPTLANTNFTLSLTPADIPNISSYEMAPNTTYSLILYSASSAFGIQRRTGYSQDTTNDYYNVSEGFTALNTFRNNSTYTNNPGSFVTLAISFGATTVPEPSSALLGGLGLLALLRRRR